MIGISGGALGCFKTVIALWPLQPHLLGSNQMSRKASHVNVVIYCTSTTNQGHPLRKAQNFGNRYIIPDARKHNQGARYRCRPENMEIRLKRSFN